MPTPEVNARSEIYFWDWYSVAWFTSQDLLCRLEEVMGQQEMCDRYLAGELPLVDAEIDRIHNNRAEFIKLFPKLEKFINSSKLDKAIPQGPHPISR